MADNVLKYFTTIQIKFPNLSLPCTVSYSAVSRTPELHIKNFAALDSIIGEELGLLKDGEDKFNIKYKLISMPTLGMTSRWTGPIDSADWAELHNKGVHIEGSFHFIFSRVQKSQQTTWHIVNVECISTTAILEQP